MPIDVITYGLCKKYVNDSAIALGAVKGAPCTIESVIPITNGNRITFKWVADDKTTIERTSLDVMNGENIQMSVMLNPSSELLGTVVQYIGVTTNNYKHNYFYECVENNNVYSWKNVSVQDGGGGGTSDYSLLINKPSINGEILDGDKTSQQLKVLNIKQQDENLVFES